MWGTGHRQVNETGRVRFFNGSLMWQPGHSRQEAKWLLLKADWRGRAHLCHTLHTGLVRFYRQASENPCSHMRLFHKWRNQGQERLSCWVFPHRQSPDLKPRWPSREGAWDSPWLELALVPSVSSPLLTGQGRETGLKLATSRKDTVTWVSYL